MSSSDLTFLDSTQLLLEFSATEREQAWQQSQSFTAASDRWHAYLNRLCVNTLLPWLQEEHSPQARVWTHPNALPGFWSLVGGTAITLEETTRGNSPAQSERLILLPSETIDHEECRIPQEWVDIPSWAADYYLVAQVEPDARWVQVWGYTTHHRLKTLGQYNASDRTYSLSQQDLIQNVSVLWVARQLGMEEPTRVALTALPSLSLAQAENLLERLSNPSITSPRLEIPFQLWGALIEHNGWRQRLYERRQGIAESRSIVQWLQTGISTLAQQVGWERLELQPSQSGARGERLEIGFVFARQLTIAGQPYELQVHQDISDPSIWQFQLRNTTPGGIIPGGFKLRLLTEDLQPFEGNEATAISATEDLNLTIALQPGEGIVWETEPIPEGYDREILRF